MVLKKPDGDIRPVLCGEVWRRYFTSLPVNTTPIHTEVVKLFTSSYDNFIQIDVSNTFNSTNRGLTLDVLNGCDSRDYDCDLKRGDVITTVDTLSNLFGYFKVM